MNGILRIVAGLVGDEALEHRIPADGEFRAARQHGPAQRAESLEIHHAHERQRNVARALVVRVHAAVQQLEKI